MYDELLSCWSRYVNHVATNIGGVYETYKKPSQAGFVYEVVPMQKQKDALNWLLLNAFNSPTWLAKNNLLQNIEPTGYAEKIRTAQSRTLNKVLSLEVLGRLQNGSLLNTNNYKPIQLLSELRSGIWKEITNKTSVNVYRRNLQRAYLERMEYLMTQEIKNTNSSDYYNVSQSDVRALVRGELINLKSQLSLAKNNPVDLETKYHILDSIDRTSKILDPNKK